MNNLYFREQYIVVTSVLILLVSLKRMQILYIVVKFQSFSIKLISTVNNISKDNCDKLCYSLKASVASVKSSEFNIFFLHFTFFSLSLVLLLSLYLSFDPNTHKPPLNGHKISLPASLKGVCLIATQEIEFHFHLQSIKIGKQCLTLNKKFA